MSIIKNLIVGNPYDLALGLDALEDRALDACQAEAEAMNLDAAAAICNLDEYEVHVPEHTEVAQRLSKTQQGDWQAVLRLTATIATCSALEVEIDADLSKIRAALNEAELAGFRATKLYSSNAYAWASHYSEHEWLNGTLLEWRFCDGTFDAALLEVNLSGVADVWIDLALID